MRTTLATIVLLVTAATAHAAAPRAATVYLDRDGGKVPASDDTPAATIPAFAGSDRVWRDVKTCVERQFAPFQLTIVDQRPASGEFITALVGGAASLLGYDNDTTNGVGPYTGELEPDAIVHVFSVGGEDDVENLCAVAAHEIGHALGLDHSFLCGDVMSYYGDQCGARTFRDVDAACGEGVARACENGSATQNSYRQIAATVGLRAGVTLAAAPEIAAPNPPYPVDDSGNVGDVTAAADGDAPAADPTDGGAAADDDDDTTPATTAETDDADDSDDSPASASEPPVFQRAWR